MKTKIKLEPVWAKCPDCDEYWCNLHQEHAHECICPPIEVWLDDLCDLPYDIKIPVIYLGDEDE